MAYYSHSKVSLGTLLNGVAANAAAASRTAEIDCTTFSNLGLTVALTRVAATALLVSLYRSYDGGTTYGLIQSGALGAGGVDTLSDYSMSKDVSSGSVSIDLGPFDMRNADKFKIVVSTTAGGASDLITVSGGAEVA